MTIPSASENMGFSLHYVPSNCNYRIWSWVCAVLGLRSMTDALYPSLKGEKKSLHTGLESIWSFNGNTIPNYINQHKNIQNAQTHIRPHNLMRPEPCKASPTTKPRIPPLTIPPYQHTPHPQQQPASGREQGEEKKGAEQPVLVIYKEEMQAFWEWNSKDCTFLDPTSWAI